MAKTTGSRRNAVAVALMARLVPISIGILVLIISRGESRELRPSDHGLPFQSFTAKSPEMELFFGEEFSPPAKRPPAPKVIGNSNSSVPDSWWKGTQGKEQDRVRKALMVATVVCGGTGVVLLVAAAVLFAVHFRRQRLTSSTMPSAANNNSSAIVVASPASAPAPPTK